MKRTYSILLSLSFFVLLYSCGGDAPKSEGAASAGNPPATSGSQTSAAPSNDPNRGIGKFTKVDLGAAVDPKMVEAGQKIFDLKCSACH